MTERVGALSEGAGKAVRLCLREFSLPAVCIQIDISVCCISRRLLIYQPGEIRTFFALLIYQFRRDVCPPKGRRHKGRAARTAAAKRKILQAEREM